ncbi:Bacterial capsule synthesis protein [Lachnospiraceae bacterium JC7]|nr:Bacterial capsule synthesis protein [Lachnospiraceae bacterium JC7]
MRIYILKEQVDRRNSRSHYRGPRSARIKAGVEGGTKRRRAGGSYAGRELRMMKDVNHLQVTGIPEQQEENEEQGRQIKVESIGKTLGRDNEKSSKRIRRVHHRNNRRKEDSRTDFGKSRKKPESRFKNFTGKEDKREKFISSGYERKKTEARFSGKTDEMQYELSDELKRLYERSEYEHEEKEPAQKDDMYVTGHENPESSGKNEVKLIFGEDLTGKEEERKKIFFNSRKSNYSGTRAERLAEKYKRIEIEDQFQDVAPYIPEEEEEETVDRRKHRWGRIGILLGSFILFYEIIIIAAFCLSPNLLQNVNSRIVEMRADLESRFMSKETLAETEPESLSETEVMETEYPENTEGITAYVNESGAIAVKNPAIPVEAEAIGKGDDEPVELLFAGDVYLSDHVMEAYREAGDISGVLSEGYRKDIDSVDYFVANEEFPFSIGGKQAENKQFTFRVHPDNISLFHEMGIDLVTLANNHTLDYGTEALLDTVSTLDDAGIRHVGAGSDLKSASESVTVSIKGKKIAFIGASRVIPEAEWAASDSNAGVFAAYDDTALLEKIKTAKEQADFVVVYVHWGEERKEYPNEVQKTLAHDIVDAGADLVIGAHPHVLQGIEYYRDVPIAYSLGNFVFGSSIPSTALLKVTIEAPDDAGAQDVTPEDKKAFDVKLQLIPGKSSAGYTEKLDSAADIAGVYSYLTGISTGISIDGNGVVHKNS